MDVSRAAYRLDLWLEEKIGRPYNALLGTGLVIEIARRLVELPHVLSTRRAAGMALTLALEAALLIHQVGALSHRFDRHRAEPAHKAEEAP
ncbi:MAG: hypothetical protein ACREEQ_08005 [Caulobacteraceae bacterium]